MTNLELLQEIDAWLSFNNSPSKEQISELRKDIKKHISEQLNILHVGSSFSFGQLLEIIHEKDPEAKYCLQYSDYEDNQWTVESLLLPHRIEKIKDDNSIRKVFIKFSNGISLVVAP